MGTASDLNVIDQYHDNREAIRELMASMLIGQAIGAEKHLKPFGIIIVLMLALAIVELGKTVLGEGTHPSDAVWIMFPAETLLIGVGF